MTKEELLDAATDNQEAVTESNICGCFVCGKVFPSVDVDEFVGSTAICPVCKKQGVLPSSTELPVHDESFLNEIKNKFF